MALIYRAAVDRKDLIIVHVLDVTSLGLTVASADGITSTNAQQNKRRHTHEERTQGTRTRLGLPYPHHRHPHQHSQQSAAGSQQPAANGHHSSELASGRNYLVDLESLSAHYTPACVLTASSAHLTAPYQALKKESRTEKKLCTTAKNKEKKRRTELYRIHWETLKGGGKDYVQKIGETELSPRRGSGEDCF
ncbi:hypothetical protein AAG570_000880 [Ranatra chinensis]|uniref:Uncharacterized protein n=1 Tax=Ranatra chinensis TaxID=642074 RepID=A0ABD0Z8S7_9HEMI